jgi:ABC-type transport system involved in multi-copper enzyme maturation permease subunit
MGGLLAYEFRRLASYKSILVILCVSLGLTFLGHISTKMIPEAYLALPGAESIVTDEGEVMTAANIGMTGVEALLGTSQSMLVTLLPILIAMLYASEYSSGVLQNIVSRGCAKTAVYLVKLASAWVVTPILLMVTSAGSASLATLFWGFADGAVDWGMVSASYLAQAIACMAIASVTVLLASLFRRTGPAMAVALGVFMFLPNLLVALALAAGEHHDAYLAFDLANLVNSTLAFADAGQEAVLSSVLVSLAYIAASTAVGVLLAHRRDL